MLVFVTSKKLNLSVNSMLSDRNQPQVASALARTCCMRLDTVDGVSLGEAEDRAATQRETEWYDCLWRTLLSAEDIEL